MPPRGRSRSRPDPTLAEQLRELIVDSGITFYALAESCGIDRGAISRFVAGERDLCLTSAGRIAEALGVEPLRVARGRRVTRKPGYVRDIGTRVEDSDPLAPGA
jgi:transcriptional regulator with XRE-family HTH domain